MGQSGLPPSPPPNLFKSFVTIQHKKVRPPPPISPHANLILSSIPKSIKPLIHAVSVAFQLFDLGTKMEGGRGGGYTCQLLYSNTHQLLYNNTYQLLYSNTCSLLYSNITVKNTLKLVYTTELYTLEELSTLRRRLSTYCDTSPHC